MNWTLPGASVADRLKSLVLYGLPHHAISRLVHRATRWRFAPWKRLLIAVMSRVYRIDLDEAQRRHPEDYEHFNDFFTRALARHARPLPEEADAVACPADGTVSEIGTLVGGRILQVKGHRFSATELLGGDDIVAERFTGGHFATVYLAPGDYHRVHMPVTGDLRGMIHVPGRLFSVAPFTVRSVPDLFARNERVVSLFATELGPMAVVLVGAICVASIETVWAGEVTPPSATAVKRFDYRDRKLRLQRGDEMGRFNMGSTVILLFPPGRVSWREALVSGARVRMGETLGHTRRAVTRN